MSKFHYTSRVLTDALLAVARSHANDHGIALSTLAYRVHGNPRFFAKIKKTPGAFTVRTFDNMMRWFDKHGGENVTPDADTLVRGKGRKA